MRWCATEAGAWVRLRHIAIVKGVAIQISQQLIFLFARAPRVLRKSFQCTLDNGPMIALVLLVLGRHEMA